MPETWGMSYERFLEPPEVEVCVECGGTLEEPNEDCQDEYHFRDPHYVKEYEPDDWI